MPQTIRLLRIALPIAFVIFLGVILMNYSSTARRRGDEKAPTPLPAPLHDEGHPTLITHEFEDTHSIGGRTLSNVTAARTVGFSSGWHTLEDVEVTIYRGNGGSYVVSAPSARFHANTKRTEVRGGVRVRSDDGVDISTREVEFDGRKLTNGIPVRFKVDEWSGEAFGVELDVDAQTLKLLEKVRATLTPSVPGAPPMQFASDTATFDRSTGKAVFDGNVEITRGGDTLAASRMVARLDQSRSVLLGVEGSGDVVVRVGGSDPVALAAAGGAKEISADHLSVETGPDGEVRAASMEGQDGLARAVIHGDPTRIVEAERFRVSLDQSTIRHIEASGRAVMTETVEGVKRTASAGLFRIYLDSVSGQMTSAYLERAVNFHSGNLTATSERANYSVADDRLVLTAEAGSAPSVESDTARLRAEVIEASPASGILRARGRVVARMESRNGTSESRLFPGSGGQIFVNSEGAMINQSEGLAIFNGHVKAWQGNNNLFADELQIADSGASMQARGGVRTTLYNTSGSTSTPMSTASGRLSATRGDGTISLNEHVVVSDGARSVRCDESQFFFDSQRRLERIISTGSVSLDESAAGRHGSGTTVVYEVGQRRILIDGDPATMVDSQGTIKGRRIVFDIAKNRVDVVRGEDQTEATIQPHGFGEER